MSIFSTGVSFLDEYGQTRCSTRRKRSTLNISLITSGLITFFQSLRTRGKFFPLLRGNFPSEGNSSRFWGKFFSTFEGKFPFWGEFSPSEGNSFPFWGIFFPFLRDILPASEDILPASEGYSSPSEGYSSPFWWYQCQIFSGINIKEKIKRRNGT